jgi:hypothetical protein
VTYRDALKQCKRVGTAHASGDALRAMYAGLIALQHGGPEEVYYKELQSCAPATDAEIATKARELLRSRNRAWEVVFSHERIR